MITPIPFTAATYSADAANLESGDGYSCGEECVDRIDLSMVYRGGAMRIAKRFTL
jgi:hypothetical protein